jgi:L-ascorbate metabolism protein UlaG (beta-lactamase superfamily)
MRVLLLAFVSLFLPIQALASTCYAFVEDLRRDLPGVRYAALGTVASTARSVKITYVAHSAFRIETEEGVTIVTDFFGSAGRVAKESGGFEDIVPTVVTMNHAHSTHWTAFPDERIPYVLRGWNHDGKGPADYRLRVKDATIRNVTTDIRGWGEPEADGNSIFIFEIADMCIGHLGHLHHKLDEARYAKVGRLDIVMAPVDGTFTLDLPDMIEVLKTFKAQIVLPMHAFGTASMERFLDGMKDEFAVEVNEGPSITVSFDTLPSRPTVMMLPTEGSEPNFLDD